MKRIGVLTSGGDGPGMNAAIRSVVRSGIDRGFEVYGIKRGYHGLVEGDFQRMERRDVGGILNVAGSILLSSRYPKFKEEEARKAALDKLREEGIEGLVTIGGDGTQAGAQALHKMGLPIVGIPATIDNDITGTAIALGVDTAANVALESIDRLRATASSLHRGMVVEVMGRDTGHLALLVGMAGGAEVIVLPEVETDARGVAEEIRLAYERGKDHVLIVVAEGASYDAKELLTYFEEHESKLGYTLRATVLGYVQRGGEPSLFDRVLASRLGAAAMELLDQGKAGRLVGIAMGKDEDKLTDTPLEEVVGKKRPLDKALLQLARILAK